MSSQSTDQEMLIRPVSGYSLELGRLIGILTYVREGTLREVAELTREQPDSVADDDASDRIGEVLARMGMNERLFQIRAFEGREPSERERQEWSGGAAAGIDEAGPVEDQLGKLAEIREETLTHLYRYSDSWLDEMLDPAAGAGANRYWHLFQLAEDEIRAREHIRRIAGRSAG
jgi:hypothetical protein